MLLSAESRSRWALSSAGRALARQARGHWFKSSSAHHLSRSQAAVRTAAHGARSPGAGRPRVAANPPAHCEDPAMSVAPAEERPDVAKYPGGEELYRLRHSAAHVL